MAYQTWYKGIPNELCNACVLPIIALLSVMLRSNSISGSMAAIVLCKCERFDLLV